MTTKTLITTRKLYKIKNTDNKSNNNNKYENTDNNKKNKVHNNNNNNHNISENKAPGSSVSHGIQFSTDEINKQK